eukprot:CAMPEP_0168609292 /NCGR_PEP_ID=MMETSP0449_2-20121227/1119_1 /TAXON_ID=1082188 /ORGANISM="Strombidium rassoulzadegani, Strain ras09" /LENGTH=206 /DNA_ID=CAMNT_0008649407 /DNA_START=18 /DNA_END=634 /DNA_ORIENTATION=+
MHLSSVNDIEQEISNQKEEETINNIKKMQKVQNMFERSIFDANDSCFKYDEITYLNDSQKNSNFSYLQSIILISAYIAGSNKESTDTKLFEMDRTRMRMRAGGNANAGGVKNGVHLVGKTKRFGIDRMIAIADFLTSLEIDGAAEVKRINHSAEFFACVNTLVKEGLLKKQTMRVGGTSIQTSTQSDDLLNIGLKCNYDLGFVEQV